MFERFLSLPLFLPRRADCSFNVEVHPESLADEKLRIMKDAGVNRTSVGVQTLDDELLRRLNRTATPELVFTAIRKPADAGCYFNADLIYGLPEQTERGLLDA